MKKAKLVYGKSYIFGFFFFGMKNSLIPLSFPSHSVSPHSPVIPLIRFPLISPLIPLSFPSSFDFPSFPSHSTVIWFPLIRFLKFPYHSPHSPGFPLIRFPLLHTQFSRGYSLSALFLFPCSLSVLSRHSPVL